MTIYDFIKEQEVLYQKPIQLEDGWNWSMRDHLRRSFLYKNSQFEEENENRDLRPNKNIVLAIRNAENRTEGFDVKDIVLYVDDADEYYKSFLVKKFHDKWALENSIDTFIDDLVDSYGDYGGVLVRDTTNNRPEVIDLRSLASCNQTDILAYPFAIKHKFSPSQLREMTDWGLDSNGATIGIEEFIILTKDEKEIFVYEVHGTMPKEWMGDERPKEENTKDLPQIQIVAYYKKQDGKEQGVTLFRKREPKLPFKFLPRDKIIGRALGRGAIEELFDPQMWTNWSEIKITEMLNSASKTLLWSDDPSFTTINNLNDVDNNEIFKINQGNRIAQLDTYPRNLPVFNDVVERWETHAQQLGASSSGLLGEVPTSGTAFQLYEAQLMESKGLHIFRQGQIATFVDEIYRDWIIPHIEDEISNDQTFLAELSGDEMQTVSEALVNNYINNVIKEKILNGEIVDGAEMEQLKATTKDNFFKSGNKKFIQILKDEMSKPISVMTNIAGKQKNMAQLTAKLTSVLGQFISNPQLRQDPEMVKLMNTILESSGLSPIMFGSARKMISTRNPMQQMFKMQPPQQLMPQNAQQPV